MQVFLQIVAFSLQIIGSDRPVLTKGKRPKSVVTELGTCLRQNIYVQNYIVSD